jgi:LacI family transcriptional regulator, repressor for deo operon, udp, cdd, tsx, nupC, and nupG
MTDTAGQTATIYDVATRAGVSISTVSLALNAPQRVKAATRDRVLAAIDELGFVPKTEAVTRARRGVGRIGVIAPFSSHPTFARRLNGVFAAVQGRQAEVVVYDEASAADSLLGSLPLTRRVDGLIVMGLPFSDDVARRLVEQQVSTVLVELRRPGFSSVSIDDRTGGRMVAEHLLQRGHERLAFVGHRQRVQYASPSENRLGGFREALDAAGRPLHEDHVRRVDHTLEAARAATHELLDVDDAPTAIFAHDDVLAGGVLRAIRDRRLATPDDVAVVGFDDSDIAEHLGLTSVHQPLEESGSAATRTLLAQLADRNRSLRHTSLDLVLVERETT